MRRGAVPGAAACALLDKLPGREEFAHMEPDGMAVCPGLCLRTGNCDTAMLAGNRQKLDGKLWEPMLSMVATRRKASKRSGASMPGTPGPLEFVQLREQSQNFWRDDDVAGDEHSRKYRRK